MYSLRTFVYNKTIGYFYTSSLIKEFLETIPHGSTVLDIGIGTGITYAYNAKLVRNKNIKITGVDIDREYVKKARYTMIDNDLEEHVRIVLADIFAENKDKRELYEDRYDYVLFSDSYAVLPNPQTFLKHCEKFLKPEGSVVVLSTLFDEFNYYLDIIKQNIVTFTTVDYGRMMTKSDLQKYIENKTSSKNVIFKLVSQFTVPYLPSVKSYMVMWTPTDSIS